MDDVVSQQSRSDKNWLSAPELTLDLFETVYDTVSFSRGLFGLSPDPEKISNFNVLFLMG